MEKRAILAIVLSLLVVMVWSIVFAPPGSPPPVDTPPAEQRPPEVASGPTQETSAPSIRTTRPIPLTQESLVTVDTGVAQLLLSSQGAGVKTVHLLAYHATLDAGAAPVQIAPAPGTLAMPLAMELRLGQRSVSLRGMAFTSSTTTLHLSEREPTGTVVFRGQTRDGMVVQRSYQFRYGSYVFEVNTQFEDAKFPERSTMTLLWGPGLQQQPEGVEKREQNETLPRSYVNGKILYEAPKGAGEVREERGKVAWTALADTYFAAVLLPKEPAAEAMVVRRVQTGALEVGLHTPLSGNQAGQTVRVYVGPKQQALLEAVDPSLGKLIDLGFFSPLARPMVQLLQLINQAVHNYGVTIILVTILIKIAFWPLTQKSYKSMQAMQKLQPKMKQLQENYKNDRQALNRAMMQLYREHKVNPLGGCLPMLIQIPFFFAFYNALLYSIELRHAPFVCWERDFFWVSRGICDLSTYDPSYITPVLMGVTMFIQQKMTPVMGDPTQAKVMQFMPLMFLAFFLWSPAGLVLYWLVQNVLSIAQQFVVNRLYQQPEAVKAEATSAG
jgi:YidC/Oxa1 family membrane protein insertase